MQRKNIVLEYVPRSACPLGRVPPPRQDYISRFKFETSSMPKVYCPQVKYLHKNRSFD
jgi:hypothetical protein